LVPGRTNNEYRHIADASTLAAIAMQPLTLFILILVFAACSSNQPDKTVDTKAETIQSSMVTDSCLNNLYIDRHSVETATFKQLWTSAEKSGYTFKDDTTAPFVKIIFQPKSAKFYQDTLKISNCKLFDSVNIHKMQIQSTKPIDKIYYPNLNVEEWQFKNVSAAFEYANALTEYYNKGYGLKSPTAVLQTNQSVYVFETAAYKFIPEMERIEKFLEPKAKVYGTNY
jgi:hypothetical protein